VELDRREKDQSLNDSSAVSVFPVKRSCVVSQIRLRQTGINHGCDYALILSALDVFGDMIGEH
jgi:hypothetical protein